MLTKIALVLISVVVLEQPIPVESAETKQELEEQEVAPLHHIVWCQSNGAEMFCGDFNI